MAIRKGLGKGTGKGYRNIIGKDPRVHSDSGKGRKQPQKIPTKFFLAKKYQKARKELFAETKKDFESGILNALKSTKNDFERRGYGVYVLSDMWNSRLEIEGNTIALVERRWVELPKEIRKQLLFEERVGLRELAEGVGGKLEIIRPYKKEKFTDNAVIFSKKFLKEEPEKAEKIRKKLKELNVFTRIFIL